MLNLLATYVGSECMFSILRFLDFLGSLQALLDVSGLVKTIEIRSLVVVDLLLSSSCECVCVCVCMCFKEFRVM